MNFVMRPTEIREYLTGSREPLETLLWLRDTFLPTVINKLNSTDVRRRLGIYSGERIPENERNLTDVRNRVSLIIEYELARVATQILEEMEINDLFWSYVVANRFPDLEIRQNSSHRGLRVEVKCLQTIAEEKSANFDTIRKDVHPETDFLGVFLWEWCFDPSEVTWDRAPKIVNAFVFHAASLAYLRDWYWLNKPPKNLGDGLQGFDLRYAVNCTNGVYNEEEGNYGKLLRIWQKDFMHKPKESAIVKQTISDYLVFKAEAITSGFDTISNAFLPVLSGNPTIAPIIHNGERVGWKAGRHPYLSAFIFQKVTQVLCPRSLQLESVYIFADKYSWIKYRFDGKELAELQKGKKPKYLAPRRAEN